MPNGLSNMLWRAEDHIATYNESGDDPGAWIETGLARIVVALDVFFWRARPREESIVSDAR